MYLKYLLSSIRRRAPSLGENEKMIRYSEKDFINEIRLMVSNNASEQEISYRALELMNSSIDWREEFRDFALDLISIIEPSFYMTNDEILENINLLGKKYYPWNEYWKILHLWRKGYKEPKTTVYPVMGDK